MRAWFLFGAFVAAALVSRAQEPAVTAPATPSLTGAASAKALEKAFRDRLGQPMETLDLDLAMFGEDFFGAQPRIIGWIDDQTLLFDWKRWDDERRGSWLCCFDRSMSDIRLERIPDDVPPPALPTWSTDKSRRAWKQGQAVFVGEGFRGEGKEIARLESGADRLVWNPDASSLFLVSDEAVFEIAMGGPGIRQRLAIKGGPKPKEEDEKEKKDPTKDLAEWHKAEQRELFRVLDEKAERAEQEKKDRKAREEKAPRITSYWPPEGFRVRGVSWSPAGTHAAISLAKEGKKARTADMADYLGENGYLKAVPTRPRVGDALEERRMDVIAIADGATVQVKDPIADAGATASNPEWSPDGKHLLVSAATRDDRRVVLAKVDLANGETTVLHEVKDEAWTLQKSFDLVWLGTAGRAVFISEATGWQQLWRVDAASGEVRQLTRGKYEITSPQVARGQPEFVVATATIHSPHERELVRIDPESGDVMMGAACGSIAALSPDGQFIATVASYPNRPWELMIAFVSSVLPPPNPGMNYGSHFSDGVTRSPSPAFESWPGWIAPEIVQIPASDGAKVPARIYRPEVPAPGKPAVCFVHGAGYLQNVHQWWSRYEREYAFHHLLRQEGYTVLDVDYRGSAGYGRDWRTAIYGHMGGRDLEDYVDAAKWLVENEGVGADRIGIYGGSYGGFITLMAMFTKPGVFAAGAALRPVTDWAHYNEGYTSNILDSPLESPEAYARSSPIRFAEGLAGHLLICHGLVDDNVHAQDSVRLAQRLIELRKPDWELAVYPTENHAFRDAASWSDEYRRIKSLFDRVLKRPQ